MMALLDDRTNQMNPVDMGLQERIPAEVIEEGFRELEMALGAQLDGESRAESIRKHL